MIRKLTLLTTTLVLTACQLAVTTPPKETRPSVAPKIKASPSPSPSESTPAASASPSPTASATPTPTPSASVSASPSPAVPTRILKGLIKMEPAYLVASGGANIVSNGGANVVALGAGSVISAGGGASLISNNGGSLISDKGLGLIGNNGSNYRVFAESSHTMLPVQGMAVVPISLLTGLPLGPAVLTDARGGYQVAVPEAEEKNVLLYAAVPGTSATDPRVADPRLRLGLIVNPAKGGEEIVDEDRALVTSYILNCLVNRVRRLFESSDAEMEKTLEEVFATAVELPPALKPFLFSGMREMKEVADELNFQKFSEQDKVAFMHQILDLIAANVRNPDLDGITLAENHLQFLPQASFLKGRSTTATLQELFKFLRPPIEAKLDADPAYFEKQDYFKTVNQYQTRKGRPLYTVQRTSDVLDFIMKAFMAENFEDGGFSGVKSVGPDEAAGFVFTNIGAQEMPLSGDPNPSQRHLTELVLRASYTALFETIVQVMYQPDVRAATIARMKAYPRKDPLQP